MKNLTATFVLLVLFPYTHAQEIDSKRIAFVNGFIDAVGDHNYKKVWKYLDKTYRKEQCDNLNGNKKQLLDELLGGFDGDRYVSMPLSEILKIELAEIEDNEGGTYTYIFRIRDAQNDVFSTLVLKKTKNKFGFEGSYG